MGGYIIPGDEPRFEEEIAGLIRPPRPPSLAGDYLTQALEFLQQAGDAGHLFAHWRRYPPKDAKALATKMKSAARRARVKAARTAVLFAALSGEAYVNEFLDAHGVLADWDYEPTIRKYLKGTEAAYGCKLFFADREAYPVLVDLYKLRDRLVHPKPGFGVEGDHGEVSAKFAAHFSLPKVSEYIVMVGGAADLLMPRAHGMDTFDIAGTVVWGGKSVIRDFARRNRRLPRWDAPSERQLFRQAGDFVMARKGIDYGPDHPYTRLRRTRERQQREDSLSGD